MTKVRLSPAARQDLADIWLRVAEDNATAADRLLDTFQNRLDQLRAHPLSGAKRKDVSPDARVLVVGRYLMLYRVVAGSIEIVRVVHGARDLDALR